MKLKVRYEDNVFSDSVDVPEASAPDAVLAFLIRNCLSHSSGWFTVLIHQDQSGFHILDQKKPIVAQCTPNEGTFVVIPKFIQITVISAQLFSMLFEIESTSSFSDFCNIIRTRLELPSAYSCLILHPTRKHIKLTDGKTIWEQFPLDYPKVVSILDLQQYSSLELEVYGKFLFFRNQLFHNEFVLPDRPLCKCISLLMKCHSYDLDTPLSPSTMAKKMCSTMKVSNSQMKEVRKEFTSTTFRSKSEAINEFVHYCGLYNYLSFGVFKCKFGVNAVIHQKTWSKANALFVCMDKVVLCIGRDLQQGYARIAYKNIVKSRRCCEKIEMQTRHRYYKFFFNRLDIISVWHQFQKSLYCDLMEPANACETDEIEHVEANDEQVSIKTSAEDLIFFDQTNGKVTDQTNGTNGPKTDSVFDDSEDVTLLSHLGRFSLALSLVATKRDDSSVGELILLSICTESLEFPFSSLVSVIKIYQKITVLNSILATSMQRNHERNVETLLSDISYCIQKVDPSYLSAFDLSYFDQSADSLRFDIFSRTSEFIDHSQKIQETIGCSLFNQIVLSSCARLIKLLCIFAELYEHRLAGTDAKLECISVVASSVIMAFSFCHSKDAFADYSSFIARGLIKCLLLSAADGTEKSLWISLLNQMKFDLESPTFDGASISNFSKEEEIGFIILSELAIQLLSNWENFDRIDAKTREILNEKLELKIGSRFGIAELLALLDKFSSLACSFKPSRSISWPFLFFSSIISFNMIVSSSVIPTSEYCASLIEALSSSRITFFPSAYKVISLISLIYLMFRGNEKWVQLNGQLADLVWLSHGVVFKESIDPSIFLSSPSKSSPQTQLFGSPFLLSARVSSILLLCSMSSGEKDCYCKLSIKRLSAILELRKAAFPREIEYLLPSLNAYKSLSDKSLLDSLRKILDIIERSSLIDLSLIASERTGIDFDEIPYLSNEEEKSKTFGFLYTSIVSLMKDPSSNPDSIDVTLNVISLLKSQKMDSEAFQLNISLVIASYLKNSTLSSSKEALKMALSFIPNAKRLISQQSSNVQKIFHSLTIDLNFAILVIKHQSTNLDDRSSFFLSIEADTLMMISKVIKVCYSQYFEKNSSKVVDYMEQIAASIQFISVFSPQWLGSYKGSRELRFIVEICSSQPFANKSLVAERMFQKEEYVLVSTLHWLHSFSKSLSLACRKNKIETFEKLSECIVTISSIPNFESGGSSSINRVAWVAHWISFFVNLFSFNGASLLNSAFPDIQDYISFLVGGQKLNKSRIENSKSSLSSSLPISLMSLISNCCFIVALWPFLYLSKRNPEIAKLIQDADSSIEDVKPIISDSDKLTEILRSLMQQVTEKFPTFGDILRAEYPQSLIKILRASAEKCLSMVRQSSDCECFCKTSVCSPSLKVLRQIVDRNKLDRKSIDEEHFPSSPSEQQTVEALISKMRSLSMV